MYDIEEELWILKRPSVAEMKRQYEEMVERLNSGDAMPFRTNNLEKVVYLRRKRLQEQVPSQDTRPKTSARFSLSVPLLLPPVEDEEEDHSELNISTTVKKIESIEEWWSDFHTHSATVKYAINIGSLSIGDQAIMELSSKLIELAGRMPSPPNVYSLDISWNDIYEEGMLSFCGVVQKLAGLTEVRIDGNQIGTVGLEAFLKALVSAQPKKRGSYRKSTSKPATPVLGLLRHETNSTKPASPLLSTLKSSDGASALPTGISLSLRETNIGDESTPCLASFLKPLPDDKQLNLVSLDLTNTYIFDGITALTLGLQHNTTLTTLILNSNMIGDQGAFAIGELLLTNRTLSRIEIRNCDIGPTGTTHLCEGLMAHPGIAKSEGGEDKGEKGMFYIDVGLNMWEFSGELLLLQTAIAKPNMIIKWREGEWSGTEEEMETLVRTFGEDVVMERLLEGKGFIPLASPTQLIASPLIASYSTVHVGTILDRLSPHADRPKVLAVLTLIVQLLEVHSRTHYKSWMNSLPTVLSHLTSWLDPDLLTSSKNRRQVEVLTVDLLHILAHINQYIIDDIVIRSGILAQCLNNFLSFPKHNVFHLRLIKLLEAYCGDRTSENMKTCIINLVSGEFSERLSTVIKEQSSLPVPARSGLLGSAVLFAKVIEPHLDTRLALSLKKNMKKFEEEQRGALGGPPPERSAIKLVLNASVDI